MESKANYTLVGLVVLILTSSLLATALWLSVGFNNKKYNNYLVYLHEAASGLSEESAVKFNGVKVGYVDKIELNQTDPQQVILVLAIEEDTPITISTFATLISQGITGVTYVGLSANTSSLTLLKKQAGEPYPVIPSNPSLFNQLDRALKDVSENVNKVSVQIQRIFDAQNAEYLKHTLANVDKFSDTLAKNSDNINQMIEQSNAFMKNMGRVSADFPEIVSDLKQGIKQINRMATDVGMAGSQVSSTMKSGKATIDQISQQTLPATIILLKRLNNITANLEVVSSEMRQNPSVIIRGTKPPKPGPGE